ncbi:hypothetical protein [Streptomyces sp. NPDC059649]|uniref:hypothetical protein n=1 Tax=Streptomyces sp. NPDC059649 TaxID=3346895 RepID=UPI0036BA83EB
MRKSYVHGTHPAEAVVDSFDGFNGFDGFDGFDGFRPSGRAVAAAAVLTYPC